MGIKPYKIEFLKDVTETDLPALPKTIRLRVEKAIKEHLTVNPDKIGKSLSYKFKGSRRMRVGDYRVIYEIDNIEHMVVVSAIRHRKDSY
ncbi:MAG: type II toxin-antitoxin system RelE/ParE family toxin [Rickettsiales bacterium]|nr:type II toxin-antitoxin system RelE/ParE family toxin [Rickettsiales bacterium]